MCESRLYDQNTGKILTTCLLEIRNQSTPGLRRKNHYITKYVHKKVGHTQSKKTHPHTHARPHSLFGDLGRLGEPWPWRIGEPNSLVRLGEDVSFFGDKGRSTSFLADESLVVVIAVVAIVSCLSDAASATLLLTILASITSSTAALENVGSAGAFVPAAVPEVAVPETLEGTGAGEEGASGTSSLATTVKLEPLTSCAAGVLEDATPTGRGADFSGAGGAVLGVGAGAGAGADAGWGASAFGAGGTPVSDGDVLLSVSSASKASATAAARSGDEGGMGAGDFGTGGRREGGEIGLAGAGRSCSLASAGSAALGVGAAVAAAAAAASAVLSSSCLAKRSWCWGSCSRAGEEGALGEPSVLERASTRESDGTAHHLHAE